MRRFTIVLALAVALFAGWTGTAAAAGSTCTTGSTGTCAGKTYTVTKNAKISGRTVLHMVVTCKAAADKVVSYTWTSPKWKYSQPDGSVSVATAFLGGAFADNRLFIDFAVAYNTATETPWPGSFPVSATVTCRRA